MALQLISGVGTWGKCRVLLYDHDLMDLIAEVRVSRLASGYTPSKYQDLFFSGWLIALSKHPKTGVRPIRISDALLRLLGKDLLKMCNPYFLNFFMRRVRMLFNLVGLLQMEPPSCWIMHMLLCTVNALPETQAVSDDPIVILTLDSKNIFNSLKRKHLVEVFSTGCSIVFSTGCSIVLHLPFIQFFSRLARGSQMQWLLHMMIQFFPHKNSLFPTTDFLPTFSQWSRQNLKKMVFS